MTEIIDFPRWRENHAAETIFYSILERGGRLESESGRDVKFGDAVYLIRENQPPHCVGVVVGLWDGAVVVRDGDGLSLEWHQPGALSVREDYDRSGRLIPPF